jgi:hydrogenase 3 maturation protease
MYGINHEQIPEMNSPPHPPSVSSVPSSAAGGKKLLLGIGNSDRGDDGVGPFIADRFSSPGWLAYNVGTAPENFTGVVRRERPSLLVMIDAADMGLPPGSIRRIPRDLIQDVGFGTHMLPLYHVIDYLKDAVAGDILLIGIQPASKDYGDPICPAVLDAAEKVMTALADGRLEDFPLMA